MTMLLNSFVFGGGGGGGDTDSPVWPAGVELPLVWITPRHVELNGSSEVTKFLNQGTTGDTNDATAMTANLATISQPTDWESKDVIVLPDTATGGYTLNGTVTAKTVVAIATYDDGVDDKFNNYDALISGGAGSDLELTGTNAQNYWYVNNIFRYFKGGLDIGTYRAPALPMDKQTIGITKDTGTYIVEALFYDEYATSRNWNGLCGDLMVFENVISDADMLLLHLMLKAFYSDPALSTADTATTYVIDGAPEAASQYVGSEDVYVIDGAAEPAHQFTRSLDLYVIE